MRRKSTPFATADSATTLAILLSLLLLTSPHRAIDASSAPSSSIMSSSTSPSPARYHYERIVFSDVDGTLVHYPTTHPADGRVMGAAVRGGIGGLGKMITKTNTNADDGDDYDAIGLPPSKTGQRGVISPRTLSLCRRLRHGARDDDNDDDDDCIRNGIENYEKDDLDERRRRIANGGVPLVLVSGMRTTTLFQRLPYLPRADAYVSESGGRIFYPRSLIDVDDVDCGSVGEGEGRGKHDDDDDDDVLATTGGRRRIVVRPISYRGMHPEEIEPFTLVEDEFWRERMSHGDAAGPDGYDDHDNDRRGSASSSSSSSSSSSTSSTPIDIDERRGRLWESARFLLGRGYVIDHGGYASSYRINRGQQTNDYCARGFDDYIIAVGRRRLRHDKEETLEGKGDDVNAYDDDRPSSLMIPDDLGCSTNLGCVDVYPAISGKRNCAEYLLHKFLGDDEDDDGGGKVETTGGRRQRTVSLKTHAYCMCDDDNDAEMAMACRAAYLPSVTSESMRALATNLDDYDHSLIVVEDVSRGIVECIATEAALEAIIERVSSDIDGRMI